MAFPRIPMRGPPPGSYIIAGRPYLDVRAAASFIGGAVSESTLRRWFIAGWTSYSSSLDVVQHKGRLLIPFEAASGVKEHLELYPLPRPGTPQPKREEFKRASAFCRYLEPESAYSRARRPQLRTPNP